MKKILSFPDFRTAKAKNLGTDKNENGPVGHRVNKIFLRQCVGEVMDKGFNEKELADIMNEIESLEREFAAESETTPEASHEEEQGEEVSSEVMQELAETPIEQTVQKTNHSDNNVVNMKTTQTNSASSSLTFKVEGEMTVSLNFEVNGQSVSLAVNSEGLCIETESGAKFSLPMHQEAARKAS